MRREFIEVEILKIKSRLDGSVILRLIHVLKAQNAPLTSGKIHGVSEELLQHGNVYILPCRCMLPDRESRE
jgi:hypothetical protein